MTLYDICAALKDLGVKEVILEYDSTTEETTCEFGGENPDKRNDFFRIKATNSDFSEHGL